MTDKPYPKDVSFTLYFSDGSEEDELPESVQRALDEYIEETYSEAICCECGDSVIPGSGKFVNRIPELSGVIARADGNRLHPTGAWVCDECDSRFDEDERVPDDEVVV